MNRIAARPRVMKVLLKVDERAGQWDVVSVALTKCL